MDPAAILDHQFRVAAYIITWVIQLGYVAWLAIKWQAQKQAANRVSSLDSPRKPSAH